MHFVSKTNFPRPLALVQFASVAALLSLVACGSNGTNEVASGSQTQSVYAQNPYNFRLSLTDAPNKDIKSVEDIAV